MAYRDVVLADGATVFLRFADASGTNANDEVGTLDGTYSGGVELGEPGPFSYDPVPSALFTGASSGQVTVPDDAILDRADGPFTYEIWVRRSETSATNMLVYMKGSQGALYFAASKMTFDKEGDSICVSEVGLTAEINWHYWVVTHAVTGAGNTKLYKDGADVTVEGAGISSIFASNANSAFVGSAGGSIFFSGWLANLAVYPLVLTPTQVLNHWKEGQRAAIRPNYSAFPRHVLRRVA